MEPAVGGEGGSADDVADAIGFVAQPSRSKPLDPIVAFGMMGRYFLDSCEDPPHNQLSRAWVPIFSISRKTLMESTRRAFLLASATTLAAEESVEEILKVLVGLASLVAVVVTATWRNGGRSVRSAAVRVRIFLREGLGIDVHHCWADILGDLRKCSRQGDRIGNFQRGSVGAIGLRFVSADSVDCNRPNQNTG